MLHYIILCHIVSVVQVVFRLCNHDGKRTIFVSQESCHILQADYTDAGCSAFWTLDGVRDFHFIYESSNKIPYQEWKWYFWSIHLQEIQSLSYKLTHLLEIKIYNKRLAQSAKTQRLQLLIGGKWTEKKNPKLINVHITKKEIGIWPYLFLISCFWHFVKESL